MDNRERALDWRPSYDPKSRMYSVVRDISDPQVRSKWWPCRVQLDQGREGACVGFGWAAELAARPKISFADNELALKIYNRAKQIDQWAGENYSGTSVLAGAKATMELKGSKGLPLIGGYEWAFGVEDIVRAVSHKGPVVLGIRWYENMYDPDEDHFIHVDGPVAGGHCILLNGQRLISKNPLEEGQVLTYDNLDLDLSRVRLHNSWGPDWGLNGEGFLTLRDLCTLIEEQDGEACIPVIRRV